jgi:hypothetical protein
MNMNIKLHSLFIALPLLTGIDYAAAQGTAFTYEGQLMDSGAPANGLYDISGGLYTSGSGGTPVTALYTNTAVPVSNGMFTITLDFGSGVFEGTSYWLQLAVRTNGTGASFTPLSPRQELTPEPYAIFAEGASAAGLSGAIPMASLSGTYGAVLGLTNAGNSFAGSGAGLTGVNAAALGGLGASNFWNTLGNAGTTPGVNFLGTTDNEPLTLEADNEPGFQIQYWAGGSEFSLSHSYGINLIAGYWGNTTTNGATGATIAGGGYLETFETFPLISTSYPNVVTGDFGTIGGGYGNTAGPNSTVPGGYNNSVTGSGSFAAGETAQTTNDNTFIWSDGSQNPFTGANYENGFNVLASGGVFFFNGAEGLHVDYLNQNNGAIQYGLRFGAGSSGEGIASQRTAGGNQYGLDFYTASANRMTIGNGGFVGINTTSPSQRLEVNGHYVLIDGGNADDGNGAIDAYIGGDGSGSDVQVGSMNSLITGVGFWNQASGTWMHIACSAITINGGADLAEPFQISTANEEIPQGSVVVIDAAHPGQLKMSSQPYDTCVAGVLSGANGINPGIQMQQQGELAGGKNVALSGRVYVLADASNGPINPGDLLTSSATPGHAMKVTDHAKAQGAILGKAMTGLTDGKGMVLVLVTLQ